MRAEEVSAVHGVDPRTLRLKSLLAGRMAAALRRQRRAPAAAIRARRVREADAAARAPAGRHEVSAIFLIACGPGEAEPLGDVIDSIAAFGGAGAQVLVAEDATGDVRVTALRRAHPGVAIDVVGVRWPTGGPPRLSPVLALGMRAALARYDFPVLFKLDTDALLTGPGLPERAAEAFAADPGAGMLGTIGVRADGMPEDYTYDHWVLDHERRWSREVRGLLDRARAGAYDGRKVHGGAYAVSRAALAAMAAAGDLRRQPPWWTQISEDLWFSLAVTAAGLRIASWGAPGDPIACASKFLPVPLAEIGPRGVLAVHSVRRGLDGEPEAQVRAMLRAQRPASARS